MKDALICSWLGLAPDQWPPNHYALLGLEPGEADVERIEAQVHERLARLRHYQLHHPEQVTEAMNRVAQAFICLTDAKAKVAYDATLLGRPAPAGEQPVLAPTGDGAPDPLAWLFGPWNQLAAQEPQPAAARPAQEDWKTAPPPRAPAATLAPPPPATRAANVNAATAGPVTAAGPSAPPSPAPHDPTAEAGRLSVPARRGLGTKRALYYRIARTRRLLRAWDEAGKYLSRPNRRLTRLSEVNDLTAQLRTIRDLLRGFPPILGGAGQPGYFVVILARQQMIVPTFKTLLASQRQELARDWRDGRQLLLAHRAFLRGELHVLRHKGHWGRAVHAVRAFLTDQPGMVLLLLGLLALNLAIWLYFTRK